MLKRIFSKTCRRFNGDESLRSFRDRDQIERACRIELSIFNGSEISIKEYSSAPKIFNIQFNGNPEAVNLVQGNLENLMAALSDKEYNFKVNRFDIGLVSDKDKPLFKRKDAISGDAGS